MTHAADESRASTMAQHLPGLDVAKLREVSRIRDAWDAGEIPLEEARTQLKAAVRDLKAHELAFIEQQFKPFDEDECKKESIQNMMLLYEGILDTSEPELPENHPIARYYQECDAMERELLAIEDLVQYPLIKNQWAEIYERMLSWKTHLSRKQNQLYSVLERKGFDRPTTTMWTLDDFIRDEIAEAAALLDADKDEAFLAMQETIVADVRDLMDKERTVLYPTSLSMISDQEFEDMKAGDAEIGYALISVDQPHAATTNSPCTAQQPAQDAPGLAQDLQALLGKYGFFSGGAVPSDQKLHVAEGSLTLDQINLIYKHLPVDLSYVDEHELVCFYSDTKHRVFPRSRNVIGRDVKNCHPRRSVHIVEEIISKFRSGEQDEAEFWINKPGLFIYIKYVAVRDEAGQFRGVLEMMQDCTRIRSLEGSRTLLTWDNEQSSGDPVASETASSDDPVISETIPSNNPVVSEAKSSADTEASPANLELSKFADEQDTNVSLDEVPVAEEPGVTAAEDVPLEGIAIGPDTKLKALLATKPELKDWLPTVNEAFKMLHSPLARVMIPKATIGMMAERSGMNIDDLIEKIRVYMAE